MTCFGLDLYQPSGLKKLSTRAYTAAKLIQNRLFLTSPFAQLSGKCMDVTQMFFVERLVFLGDVAQQRLGIGE